MKGWRQLVYDMVRAPGSFLVLVIAGVIAAAALLSLYERWQRSVYTPFANFELTAQTDDTVVVFQVSARKLVDATLTACTAGWEVSAASNSVTVATTIYDEAGRPTSCSALFRVTEQFTTQQFRVLVPTQVLANQDNAILRLCWAYEGQPTWCTQRGYHAIDRLAPNDPRTELEPIEASAAGGEPRRIAPLAD